MSNKMDRQGSRTPAELEYKYNFGKSFAEVMGIAEKAKESAETANSKFDNMTQEQIFNLLTTDGENQGLYRDDAGNVYINASYINTGQIRMEREVVVEPGVEVLERITAHIETRGEIIPESEIPLYDFNNDGYVDDDDYMLALAYSNGDLSFSNWSGAKKSKFTVVIDFFDENNTLSYTGTDMWGKVHSRVIGLKSAFIHAEGNGCLYQLDGDEKEWLNPLKEFGVSYRTAERHNGEVVYTKLLECDFTGDVLESAVTTQIDFTKHSIVGINYVYDNGYSVTAQNPDVTVSLKHGTDIYYDIYVSVPSYGVVTVEIKYT